MKLGSFWSVLSAVAVVAARAIPRTNYDVIVVGGGPSGLSALSGVSRVRRTALLFDNHQYRNGPTRAMHDVIGNDGKHSSIEASWFTANSVQVHHQMPSEPWLANRSLNTQQLTSATLL